MSRDYDIVVFGATGFTGALTAQYLAAHAPAGLRWAVGGRNRAKLDALGLDIPTVEADTGDPTSLQRLAESARVVVTTVGPYLRYGEPLVAACAQAGTDYVDLTGEPEFVDLMYLRHHATARKTGARLVHACGFDSIPHDLGALFTVEQLPAGQPIRLTGYVSASGTASGGTFESAVTAFSRFRQASAAAAERRRAEAAEADRRRAEATEAEQQRGETADGERQGTQAADAERRRAEAADGDRKVRTVTGRPGYDHDVRSWVLPLPTIDPQIVVRSARELDRYGPDFAYGHFAAIGNPLVAAGAAIGVAGAFAAAQFGPTRQLLLKARPAGTGPTQEQRDNAWFKVRFVGTTASGARAVTEVAGGDPGYGETSKMLAESALCLALDPLPATAGQVTTAVAMGDVLRSRLQRAGITFRVVDGR